MAKSAAWANVRMERLRYSSARVHRRLSKKISTRVGDRALLLVVLKIFWTSLLAVHRTPSVTGSWCGTAPGKAELAADSGATHARHGGSLPLDESSRRITPLRVFTSSGMMFRKA